MMYCDTCGSSKVEGQCYVNLNTLEVEDNPEFDINKGPQWCYGCNDNCTVTEDPEEYLSWIVINAGEEKYEQLNDK